MVSIDTNLLLYAYSEAAPEHEEAFAFITSLSGSESVALSEFVLTELYLLLRNPVVLKKPLSAPDAAQVIQSYRQHPRWKILGFPPTSREVHTELWQHAATPGIARRRIYDTRTALCLRAFGVTHFATANVKDFVGFGFSKVWNPLPSKGGRN
ncbi:MAG: PIN domain-containing protein [Verrucomicrobia bacterium]|nr:PIN domain-containing protein [Verrucomicrobiota bacterium]